MSILHPRQSGARLIFKPTSCKNRPDFYPERKRTGQGEPQAKNRPSGFSTPKGTVAQWGTTSRIIPSRLTRRARQRAFSLSLCEQSEARVNLTDVPRLKRG